jgi:ATP-dependent DNA helicase RecQ
MAPARAVLRGETTLELRRAQSGARSARSRGRPRGTGERATPAAASRDPDGAATFERLRALRARLAGEQQVPAYVVFHDATLHEIATRRPRDLSALADVPGIGAAKLARYGEAVLQAVAGAR